MSDNLRAWAHWKLLEKDAFPGEIQMATDVQALFERLEAAEKVIEEARTIKAAYFLEEPLMHGDQNHRDWLRAEVNHAFGSLENLIALYDKLKGGG